MNSLLNTKLAQLKQLFSQAGKVLVAFSGGVDSTFVLKVAVECLKDKAIALTAVSASLAEADKKRAIELAAQIGAQHLLIDSFEIENPDYAANPTNRCYFCKTELYDICVAQAKELGIATIVDGFNADDKKDYRPGFQAKQEHAIVSPLLEAGLTKDEIRQLSRDYHLPTWDQPASPCLASRIPYGTAVTPDILGKIDRLEAFLKSKGLSDFRVRYHDKMVRLEISVGELDVMMDEALRLEWISRCKKEGFEFVTLDLEGFRSGRLNENILLGSRQHGNERIKILN